MGLVLFKFLARFKDGVLTTIIAESYSTILRSVAIGFIGSLGRLGSAISPFLYYKLYIANNYVLFFVSAIFMLIMLLATLTFPVDMT